MTDYKTFLKSKQYKINPIGKDIRKEDIHKMLFPFQNDIVRWAVKKGRCAIFLDTGLGKALDNETNVITPEGMKKIKDVKVGDWVIGSNGFPVEVNGIFPQGMRNAYKITFSDNSNIICDELHLWDVRTKVNKYRKESYKTLTTKQIIESGLISQKGYKWFIPMVKPIQFKSRKLLIDSYLLGALLGDGCMSQGFVSYSTADIDMINKLSKLLPLGIQFKKVSKYDFNITGNKNGGHIVNPLVNLLAKLGLMYKKSETKFIPDDYKFADLENRIKLLQGLMDTDGSVTKCDNHLEFDTISKQLSLDIQFIIQSLGGTAKILIKIPKYEYKGKKRIGQICYRVSIKMPKNINPFSLKRKSDIYKCDTKYEPMRGIKKIEMVGQRKMTCIKVNSNDSLFVIENCIVTHNTFIQLEWARLIGEKTLIIAPLSVARQTIREGKKINIKVTYAKNGEDLTDGINITNYENADNFNESDFDSMVLDESSILKSISGKTRKKLTDNFSNIKYKLCCTATPAPNDYIELGNHTEFLGIYKRQEMLSMFFINANKEHTFEVNGNLHIKKGSNKGGQEWRLKHHAEESFFEWMTKWSITMIKPSNLGYRDDEFILPELKITPIFIKSDYIPEGMLFFDGLHGLGDRADVRRASIKEKIPILKNLITNKNLDKRNSFVINYQYENKTTIQSRVLSKASEGTPNKEIGVLSFEQKQDGHGEKELIQQGILSKKQNRVEQKNKETAGQIQFKEKNGICTESHISGAYKKQNKGISTETSTTEKNRKIKKIRNFNKHIQFIDEKTKKQMCDLRNERQWELQNIPSCRPRPQNEKGQGHTLCELQQGNRIISKQSEIIKKSDKVSQWVIWCGLDEEQREIEKILHNLDISYSSIYGKLKTEEKENKLCEWLDGKTKILLSKTKICGFGLNLQCASNMVFYGLNDSWETYYQAIRRCWRFGQKKNVNVYVIMSENERDIYKNIVRKDLQAQRLRVKMVDVLKNLEKGELKNMKIEKDSYEEKRVETDNFTAMLGDSCKRLKEIKDNSIDLSIYSPPFLDLFIYSNSNRDLGNSRTAEEFYKHYEFIVNELLRVTKQGRLSCVHTSDIPAMANRDGYIGLKNFPGKVIELHQKCGWVFVGRCFIQKNPQSQAIRTKCKSLLFVQLNKDSSHSRPALVDQILLFRKEGENKIPVTPVKNGELDNEKWINWAHGIWTDISETNTLQYYIARDKDDEKHICPLQLETIERCIKLYSNPKETVLSPFMGIGSECFMALKLNRKAIGIELKESYFDVAVKNLKSQEMDNDQLLFEK